MISQAELENILSNLLDELDKHTATMCDELINNLYNGGLGDETIDAIRTLRKNLEIKDYLIVKTLKDILEKIK